MSYISIIIGVRNYFLPLATLLGVALECVFGRIEILLQYINSYLFWHYLFQVFICYIHIYRHRYLFSVTFLVLVASTILILFSDFFKQVQLHVVLNIISLLLKSICMFLPSPWQKNWSSFLNTQCNDKFRTILTSFQGLCK